MIAPEVRREQAEVILKELGARLCTNKPERDAWDWAYWPTVEMVESQDAGDEMSANGDTVRKYVIDDMKYRLGEQLQDMAKDVPTDDKDYPRARREARAAKKLAAQLEDILAKESK